MPLLSTRQAAQTAYGDLGGLRDREAWSGREIVMRLKTCVWSVVGSVLELSDRGRRDERGLSQSAETAILLAGAVTIALLVVALITAFVKTKLAQI